MSKPHAVVRKGALAYSRAFSLRLIHGRMAEKLHRPSFAVQTQNLEGTRNGIL